MKGLCTLVIRLKRPASTKELYSCTCSTFLLYGYPLNIAHETHQTRMCTLAEDLLPAGDDDLLLASLSCLQHLEHLVA